MVCYRYFCQYISIYLPWWITRRKVVVFSRNCIFTCCPRFIADLMNRYDWSDQQYERDSFLHLEFARFNAQDFWDLCVNQRFDLKHLKEWTAAKSNPHAIWSKDSYGEEVVSLLKTISAGSSRELAHQKADVSSIDHVPWVCFSACAPYHLHSCPVLAKQLSHKASLRTQTQKMHSSKPFQGHFTKRRGCSISGVRGQEVSH